MICQLLFFVLIVLHTSIQCLSHLDVPLVRLHSGICHPGLLQLWHFYPFLKQFARSCIYCISSSHGCFYDLLPSVLFSNYYYFFSLASQVDWRLEFPLLLLAILCRRRCNPLLKSSWFYAHAYNPSTVRLVLLSRGWYLATSTCVKLSVGPITQVESYGQVHKSWRTGSCLPFGNCNCYYLYLVKCLFLFLFVCSVVALVLSLFCPEGYPVWLTQQTTLAIITACCFVSSIS